MKPSNTNWLAKFI